MQEPCARRAAISHLVVRSAICYCVRIASFLYSRKLLVIRARARPRLARCRTRQTSATRVLRGFSPQRVADAIDHRERTLHRGLLHLRCRRHVDGTFASRQRLRARTLHHLRHLRRARSARCNRVTAHDHEASCPRRARRHAVDARTDSVGRCRHCGKEFADYGLGRLTAELSRGETLSLLQHKRRRVGWGRDDVTDSP